MSVAIYGLRFDSVDLSERFKRIILLLHVELEHAIVSGPSEDETSQDASAASPAPAVNRKIRRAKK